MRYGKISDDALDDAIKHHSAEDIDIVRMAEELRELRACLRIATKQWISHSGNRTWGADEREDRERCVALLGEYPL